MFSIFAFAAGVVVGAFSHKWLAAKAQVELGVSPQEVADKVKKVI